MKPKTNLLASALLAAASLTFIATPANATTLTWAGTDGNNSWNYTDTNWSNGSTFAEGDSATFDATATEKNISIEDNITAGTITVSSDDYTFTIGSDYSLSATTLTIDSGASLKITGSGKFVTTGYSSSTINGSLTIGDGTGGTTTFKDEVDVGSYGTGTLTITGETTTFGGNVLVGEYGNGTIEISDGETTFKGDVYVGAYGIGSITIASLDGTGGKTTFKNEVYVGYSGTGSLTITGGETTFSNYVYLGYRAGSSGSLTITGGTTTFEKEVDVGVNGKGELTITGGTTTFEGYVYVGSSGSDSLTITDGATIFDGDVYVGYSGELTITGGKTTFKKGVHVGDFDTGVLTIGSPDATGGETTFESSVYLGSYDYSSGSLSIASLDGTDNVTTTFKDIVYVGYSEGSTGTLTITGGKATFSANVYVGYSGTGSLTITGGTTTFSSSVTVAANSSLSLSGGTTTADSIEVAGSLQLTGGELTVKTINLSYGSGSFSGGILNVSEITGNGSLSFGDGLTVNLYETASLSITTDIALSGTVTFNAKDNETIKLSGTISGSGTLAVTGNGSLTLSGDNSSFSGDVTIDAGKVVAANASALGTGTVTIENGGTLEISQDITISNNITIVLSEANISSSTPSTTSVMTTYAADAAIYALIGEGSIGSGVKITITVDEELAELLFSGGESYTFNIYDSSSLGISTENIDYSDLEQYGYKWNGDGTITLLPEPSAFGLLFGLGTLALTATRRRRRKVA